MTCSVVEPRLFTVDEAVIGKPRRTGSLTDRRLFAAVVDTGEDGSVTAPRVPDLDHLLAILDDNG
jgi:hypothetical protein